MKKYLYVCSIFEQTILANSAFNELNLLDVNRGGQNFSSTDVIKFLETFGADGGKVKPLSTEYCLNFTEFLSSVLNSVMMFSNLTDAEIKKLKTKAKGLITFKLNPLNYSKQKFVLEIINTIINAKYDFNLFIISENV